jgi:hypothetical protein
MPYKIIKNPNNKTYSVINILNGKKKSKSTTLKKAKKQIRLLYMIENQKSIENKKNKTTTLRKYKKRMNL